MFDLRNIIIVFLILICFYLIKTIHSIFKKRQYEEIDIDFSNETPKITIIENLNNQENTLYKKSLEYMKNEDNKKIDKSRMDTFFSILESAPPQISSNVIFVDKNSTNSLGEISSIKEYQGVEDASLLDVNCMNTNTLLNYYNQPT